MKKKFFKGLLIINILLLSLLIIYRFVSYINEFWFSNYNLQSVQQLNNYQNDNFSFVVTTAVETNFDSFKEETIPAINSDSDIKFVIAPGNNVLDGGKSKYLALRHIFKKIDVPTLVSVGDNEIVDGGAKRYFEYFGNYYYSLSYGNSYFYFLDSTGSSNQNEQLTWLKTEFAKSKEYSNKFVFINDNPLDNQNTSLTEAQKSQLQTLFIDNKIDYVISNDDSRGTQVVNGISYLSTGNSGDKQLHEVSMSDYGYYKISVSGSNIKLQYIDQTEPSINAVTRFFGGIGSYFATIVYFQFFNILLVLSITLIIILTVYRKVSVPVDYYRDFSGESIDPDQKLKIAMFTNNYLPFIGGVPISIELLAAELRKEGHEVVIFAPDYPDAECEKNIYRIKLLHFAKKSNFNFAIANLFSTEYKQQFKNGNFDLVHVHHPFWVGSSGLHLGRKYNIPVILTYHTRLELYSENLIVGKTMFQNYLSHKMIYRFAQRCDGIIAPTPSAKEYLENIRVGTPKIVSPTGIDFNKYNNQTRLSLGSKDEIILCSVSRLSVEKNIDFLIDGLKLLTTKTKVKFKCYIIGTGPDLQKLKEKVKSLGLEEIIIFTGAVARNQVANYYLSSDIFVFASKSETQGMVLLEAMAGNCPVVCVNSSGIDDVVTNEFNGFKTVEDLEQWTNKLKLLMEEEELCEKYADNAYKFTQDYSMPVITKNVVDFYLKIAAYKESNHD